MSHKAEEYWVIVLTTFFLASLILNNYGFTQQPTSMSHLHRFCFLVVLHTITHIMRQHNQKSSESFMYFH